MPCDVEGAEPAQGRIDALDPTGGAENFKSSGNLWNRASDLRPWIPAILGLAAAAIMLAAFAVLFGHREARPAFRAEGDRLMDGNETVFIRGAMYFQPHAFHQYFWEELDLAIMREDFKAMRDQGFNAVGIQVNWASFMPSVDQNSSTRTLSDDNEQKLVELLTEAERDGLYTILWFGISRIPEGVEAKPYEEYVDVGGVKHGPFSGYLLYNYPGIAEEDTFAWRCFVEFHERIARITREFERIIYDPLDWQHLNMNTWSWDDPLNLKAWRGFLQDQAEDLRYWNRRWGEQNPAWEDVVFPVDSWVVDSIARIETSHYHDLPVLPYTARKWNDFNQWHDLLYQKVAEEITSAIKRGNPRALVGQRIDIWRYGYHREETWGVGSVDLYFAGDYPARREEAEDASSVVMRNLNAPRTRAKDKKPVVFWETGIPVKQLYPEEEAEAREARRAGYLKSLDQACLDEGLAGWCWWVWRDYYLDENSKDWGLVAVDNQPKPAIAVMQELEGRAR